MKKNKKENVEKKSNAYIFLLIGLGIILFFCLFINKDYELDSSEKVALSSLRLAIAKSAVDGSGELSTEDFNTLGKMVSNYSSSSEWFEDDSGSFYGINKDTNKKEVTLLCNSNYCAKFTVTTEDDNDYLVDYSFEEAKDEDGHYIYIGDNVSNE